MRRFPDWVIRLDAFLSVHQASSFRYGQWDCCLFIAGAIEVMTGCDLAAPFRGTYRTSKEARQQHGAVCAIAARVFADLPTVEVRGAQRGDVVLIQRSRDHSLGLIDLTGRHILAVAQRGFYRVHFSRAVRAWHI